MDMDGLKSFVCTFIDSNSALLNDLSQEVWRNPELSNEEFKAHDYLTDLLESTGFNVQRNYILETGFKATFVKGDPSAAPNIAFLCEYDALPGIGHACGHNLIAEVGIGAALAVKAALESSDRIGGSVTVFGTPAEETSGGKLDFVSGGAFDDVDVALMSHPAHFAASQPVFSAMQDVNVTYNGKESHAASNPWDGVNALDAVVMAYISVSCLRQQVHETSRIHGIIIKGGEAVNIIPRVAEVMFCVRSNTYQRLLELRGKVEGCIRGAAVATGCEVKIDWSPRKFLPVESDKNLLKIYEENSVQLGNIFTTDKELLHMTTGSTDMGNVSHVKPSLHPYFNIGGVFKEHTQEFATQAGSSEAQTATLREAKTLACVAVELLYQPILVQSIRQEFLQNSFYQEFLKERNNL